MQINVGYATPVIYFKTYITQCFPQVENLLVVVGGAVCDGMACDGMACDSAACDGIVLRL